MSHDLLGRRDLVSIASERRTARTSQGDGGRTGCAERTSQDDGGRTGRTSQSDGGAHVTG